MTEHHLVRAGLLLPQHHPRQSVRAACFLAMLRVNATPLLSVVSRAARPRRSSARPCRRAQSTASVSSSASLKCVRCAALRSLLLFFPHLAAGAHASANAQLGRAAMSRRCAARACCAARRSRRSRVRPATSARAVGRDAMMRASPFDWPRSAPALHPRFLLFALPCARVLCSFCRHVRAVPVRRALALPRGLVQAPVLGTVDCLPS